MIHMADNKLIDLSNLFGNKLFRIPDYQRGYAWQEPQLKDFWNDLNNLKDGKNHYTGLLTLKEISDSQEIDNTLSDDDKWLKALNSVYHVVDGQQRLTTSIILINELVKFFKSNNITSIMMGAITPDKIREKYLYQISLSTPPLTGHIFGYAKDNPSYNCLKYDIFNSASSPIVGTPKETTYTKNLKDACKFFKTRLEEINSDNGIEAVESIYKKLVRNLKFNIYEIDNEYDVFVAFETMNNRGKKLSNLELLKNRLIYLTTLFVEENYDEKELRKQINLTWKAIYTWLGKNDSKQLSDDDFLRTHWIAYYQTPQKKANEVMDFLLNEKFTTKNVKGFFNKNEPNINEVTPKDVLEYVHSLRDLVKYYYFIHFPDDDDFKAEIEERTMLKKINRMGTGFFKPLLMVAFSKNECDRNKRLELLKAIERFRFVRFELGGRRSDMGGSDYYRYAEQLNEAKANDKVTETFDEITSSLNSNTDLDMESSIGTFVNNIKEYFRKGLGYYAWTPTLQYVLYEYENALTLKNDLKKIPNWSETMFTQNGNSISIEHILPQTLNEDWQKDFKKYKNKSEHLTALTGALGNLLLLSQPINSSLQNDNFADKVDPPEGKKRRGYRHGTHSEIEVVKMAEEGNNGNLKWTAKEIKKRSEKLLNFLIEHWELKINDKQRNELINLSFVK